MDVKQRKKSDGNSNIEDLPQTNQKSFANGLMKGQARAQTAHERKQMIEKVSSASVAKKTAALGSYVIKCLVSAIAIFWFLLALLPLLVVYNILKMIEKQLVYLTSGWVAMSGQDALWLQDSEENMMIINSVMVVECSDIEHLVNSVRDIFKRCLSVKDERGGLLYDRFTKCIYPGQFHYFLKEASNFDISDHVYAYQGTAPKSQREMEELISNLSTKVIPFDKPAWRFLVIPKTYEDKEAIILFQAHHSLADGISFTRFMLDQFPDKKIISRKIVKFSAVDRKWMLLHALLTGAYVLAEKVFGSQESSILHGHPLRGVKKMAWSKPIDLNIVKKIKNSTGSTVNDVMMACVSMSFHDYFKAHGITNPPDITASVPVDVRPQDRPIKLENNFAIVSLKLPVSKVGALESLSATKRNMDDIKHSGEAFVIAIGGNLTVEYMPEWVNMMWNSRIANKHSLVLSNVPGPQEPFTINGLKCKAFFFAPPQRNLVGIGIGIYSWAGKFSVAVQGDLNCLADPRFIVEAFESHLSQLEQCVCSNGHTDFDSGIE